MLSPQDQIVYLSAHAFHHSFSKPSLIEDIQKVIVFYRERIRWDEVVKRSQEWGARIPAYCALFLAADKARGLIPAVALEALAPKEYSAAIHKVLSAIMRRGKGTHNAVYPLYFCMAGTFLSKTAFLFLSLFPPPRVIRIIYAAHKKRGLSSLYAKRIVDSIQLLIKNRG
jgi:hypothetical protein